MPNRMIHSHGGSKPLIDTLGSLLALEALVPGSEIYVISPYISNSPILENKHNRWSAVFPLTQSKTIYFADILNMYAWLGSCVRLICDPDQQQTREFLQLYGEKFECRTIRKNHEKGLITSSFYLHGSMNFTYSGININGERVEVKTERADISAALIAARARWEEADEFADHL